MNYELLYIFLFVIAFLGLLLFIEFLYVRFRVPAEITRKTGHVAACLFSLVFLFTFQSYWYVIVLGLIFFFLLFIGRRFHLFQSIDSIKRKTAGSYLLPVSISLLFIISKEANDTLLFILPLLILGISDPLACIMGTLYRHKTRKIVLFRHEFDKTILGSFVFFISSFSLSIIVLAFFSSFGIQFVFWSLFIAVFSTLIEMVSLSGTDNFTVPLGSCLLLYFISDI